MQIVLAKNLGFCDGVKRAVNLAKDNSPAFTIGDIIHNSRVVNDLRSIGVVSVDDLSLLKKGDNVIIRAHGITPDKLKLLEDKGCHIFDATCPSIKKTQEIIKNYSTKGYKIIIIGNKTHDEIKSLVGFCSSSPQVINDVDEVDLSIGDRFVVVAQSTCTDNFYNDVTNNIKNNILFNSKIVVFFKTICYTTTARQNEAVYLSKQSDCVLVIGDKNSANCNRLFDVAKRYCPDAFIIDKISDLESVMITKYNRMAILAAASTPNELIEEVLTFMSDTQNNPVLDVAENNATVDSSNVATATPDVEEKKAFAEKTEITMEDVLASDKTAGFTTYREGKRVHAKIIDVNESGLIVAIGGKKDGFIDKSEVNIDGSYNPADFKIGEEVDAIIINKKGDSTYVTLSKREIDLVKKNDEEALKAFDSKEFTVEPPLKIVKNKEGNPVGLEGKLGAFTVFIPGSQIRIGRVNNLEEYLDKKLRLRLLAKNGRRVTASQRVILEEEKEAKKKEKDDSFWSTVVPGAVVKGKVIRFPEKTKFGAFVSVQGHDCLAHISDLSWNKISDPAEVLEINSLYDFVVLKADRDSDKISLGYKQLQKKPYELAAEKYPVGSIVKGTIARIQSFGAFVQIEDGIDGLIHVSQISHKYVKEASELLKEGQEIEAKVIKFVGNRITLSMKELEPAPEVKEEVKEEVIEEVAAESEIEVKSKAPRAPRKKFEYNPEKAEERKRDRRDTSDEPHEWVSDSGNATLADLLKGIDFKFDDENK